MKPCPACLQYKVHYAFCNSRGERYLRCDNCELVISEKADHSFQSGASLRNESRKYKNFDELLQLLKAVPAGKTVEIVEYFNEAMHLSESDNFDFALTRRVCYILFNRFFFENVKITHLRNKLFSVSAKKKISNILRVSFIVPVYNEEATIEKTITSLLNLEIEGVDKEIIVVESKSGDNTREILSKNFKFNSSIKIVYQEIARGKGNAVRDGLKLATGDFIAIQDADDEYDVLEYLNLLPPLIFSGETFVLGSRHTGEWWKMRKFGTQPAKALLLNAGHVFFTFLINAVTRCKMTDPFTMFKIFRKDVVSNLTLVSDRFDFDHEIVIKLIKSGNIPIELPVNYRSRSFDEGKKIKILRDPINWISAIVRFGLLGK